MKYTKVISSIVFVLPLFVQAEINNIPVEVMLADSLDESRGYCLDVAGGQGENAPLDKGLQAHTCYHYKGEILVDQGFDVSQIAKGQFRLPYFDICMTATAIAVDSSIVLASCSQLDTQKFALTNDGQLASKIDPSLCITVSSTEKREGRGSTPVHVMRPLSLQLCDEKIAPYQTWKINTL